MAKDSTAATKAAEAKKKAQAQVNAKERRTLAVWVVVGIIIVGLFAALVAYIVRQGNVSGIDGETQFNSIVADESGGIGLGVSGEPGSADGSAPVRLDVYLDFMCPFCQRFEEQEGPMLAQLRAEGLVEVYYHPVAYLDRFSQGTNFSTRSASATALIADEAPEQFQAFFDLMFANQPAEGTTGLSDAQIQEVARQAGVPADVIAKIPEYAYSDWARAASEKASTDGIGYTPAIVINGELQDTQTDPDAVSWAVPGALEAALREAAAN